jgi:hypothetical protein
MAIIQSSIVYEGGGTFNRLTNNGQPYYWAAYGRKFYQVPKLCEDGTNTDALFDLLGADTLEELQAEFAAMGIVQVQGADMPTPLPKYLQVRHQGYFSFREQDLGVQIPTEMYLLRQKFNVVGNPTMGELFQSIDPDVLTYIKKYNGVNYVIVPMAFSAKRVIVGTGETAYPSSEVEELNQLASAQAQFESGGVYKTFPSPGSTIFTYDEFLAFNWDVI